MFDCLTDSVIDKILSAPKHIIKNTSGFGGYPIRYECITCKESFTSIADADRHVFKQQIELVKESQE